MRDEPIGTGDVQDVQDRELLAAVGGMLERNDPPPGWMVDLAKLSFELRGIDAELAELVADSRVDAPAVAVRSTAIAAEPRMLTFETDDLSIDIEVSLDRSGKQTVVGQLLPEQMAHVEVHQPGRPPLGVAADEYGRFILGGVAPGAFRLVCHRPDHRSVVSEWVRPA
jgi:hypothetical protein